MKFEPTGGNVVLKSLDPDEMTTGGVGSSTTFRRWYKR